MSEFKGFITSNSAALFAAFFPSTRISGPLPETLALWDRLLSNGQRVVAIGGADAHANAYSLGPIQRTVFPYQYLFRAVNTHLLLDSPLSDDWAEAKSQVLHALRTGHGYVAYDLAGTSRGFGFSATCHRGNATMGDEIRLKSPVTLRIRSPLTAILRLIRDGELIVEAPGQELDYETVEPGVYRVEAYRRYRLKRRGWVFTNPIYVRG
jgi:hypothetical protein